MKAAVIPVTPLQQNCSLVWCENTMKAALVDPGGEVDRLKAAVDEAGVTLEKILVTHGHLDHAGAVADLAEEFGLPIEGPQEADRFWISRLDAQCREYGFGELRAFTPDRWLDQGDTCTVGEQTFDVLHCPGHTPGHVVFFHAGERVAFVGDVLFQGSIGRSDFPRGDFDTLIRSIRENLFPLGDDVTFVPGHGSLSTFGHERESNPYVADRLFARNTG
ncbi:MAG TPA: MBL fold metallo-hydrolase [Rhodospirillaceae bacterium]|nr:MBL fold metallo-hydrolase [Rhodospirillaceae bacterium]